MDSASWLAIGTEPPAGRVVIAGPDFGPIVSSWDPGFGCWDGYGGEGEPTHYLILPRLPWDAAEAQRWAKRQR